MSTNMNTNMNKEWESKFYEFCSANKMNLFTDKGEPLPQHAAVMETKNCVVAAGAGSGKTTVLSYRFLRMVASGISPERILTITFTKKATAEMKSRIYELLQKGHEKGLVTSEAMKKFSDVTISTVDSFCSEIVRRDAVHQGVPTDFRIQDNDDFEEMSKALVDALLEENKDKEVVKQLHSHLKVDDIESIFKDVAYNFLNIARPFDDVAVMKSKKALKEQIEAAKDALYTKPKMSADDKRDLEFYDKALEASNLAYLDDFYKLIQSYEKRIFDAKRSAGVLAFGDVMQLAIKILKENEAIRNLYKEKFDNIMIDEFQDNNDDYRKLLYLLSEKLDSHLCDAEGIPVKENLCPDKIFLVGDEKQSIYKFRGADVTVFKRLCNELCPQPIELSRNWRSEPSIINFCNATFPTIMSSEDSQTTNEGVSFEARYLPLETRPQTFGLKSRIALLHPDMGITQNQASDNSNEDEDQQEFLDSEAEAKVVASFIKTICSTADSKFGPFLVPDDKQKDEAGNPVLRLPHYNEIGLLLKVGSHQAYFEEALTQQGIPYSVTEARSLMKGNLVNDFYNALQYCVFPYDKISYAAYLKSPFCALKDDKIEQILAYKWPAKEAQPLEETLNTKMEKADANLEKLKEIIASGSICKILDYLWYDLGYRDYMLSHELNRPYLEDFNNLYTIAVQYDSEGESLVSFLDYLRPLLNSTDKIEMEAVYKEQIDGVQIMTIHKSKGLAFKIVIVADMQSGARDPGGTTSENVVQGDKLFLRYVPTIENKEFKFKNPIYKIEKSIRNEKENAEAKRVLYVAETRAKYHLIFSGVIKKTVKIKDPTPKKPNPDPEITIKPKFSPESGKRNSILTYLMASIGAEPKDDEWSFSGEGFEFEDFCVPATSETFATKDKTKDEIKKIFDSATVPTLNKSLPRTSVTHAQEEEESQTMSSNSKVYINYLPSLDCDALIKEHEFATGFGTLTHKILEDNLKGQPEQLDADLEELLAKEDFTAEQKLQLIDGAKSLASNFLESALYAQIKDLKLMSEKRFLLFNGKAYVDGVIDLLALGANEAYVIDFKTDASYVKEAHKEQLEQYVKAIKSIYPDKAAYAYVCYLRKKDCNLMF